jgi:gamma-carbonic anhydrase
VPLIHGLVRNFLGKKPTLASGVYLAQTSVVIGDVEIGADSNVWYGSVLRGDVGSIRIGARTNIQDLSMVHLSKGLSNTIIGNDVTVGHNVIVHGATIHDGALIGMGAILLDNCEVGAEALVAAGTLLTIGTKVPPRTLVRGQPGRIIRDLTENEWLQGRMLAAHYVELARQHAAD